MKILFFGGTGRLSMDVAELASKKGHDIYLLTRGSSIRKLFVKSEYHMLQADIRNPEACKTLIEKHGPFDVILDFLSFTPDHLKNKLSIVDGNFQQYIFISSATVYKDFTENDRISEAHTSIGNTLNDYAYHKFLCERYLSEYFKSRTDNYTIIRPYVTYGKTRVPYPLVPRNTLHEWTLVDRILHDQPIPTFHYGKIMTTLTHTRDFARGVVPLFCNPVAYGEAFHITSCETTTWDDVLKIIGTIIEKTPRIENFSTDEICSYFPEYTGVILGDKGRHTCFDTSKLCQIVPDFHRNTVPLSQGLSEMIEFYQKNPEYKIIDKDWNQRMNEFIQKYR